MSITRITVLLALAIYTVFAVWSFLHVAKYSFSALYAVGLLWVFFKILKYKKNDSKSKV